MTTPDQAAMLEIIATAADEISEEHRVIGNREGGISTEIAFALQDAFRDFANYLRTKKPVNPLADP